jgi:hypothetical protein
MYFWAGVSAIAGALRRKVWLDMRSFRWYPNFYIIFVAPPGVVAKSTTSSVAMKLLHEVPGIKFGPDVVTWQKLIMTFAESGETFVYEGEHHTMSALTLEASEFGNLLNPQDREMIDVYVHLWDGHDKPFEKSTKTSGNDVIYKPWINIVACTTPAWIAGNFPEYIIGGGFTSRCVFVYAEEKEKLLAYPDEVHFPDYKEVKAKLIEDLTSISLDLCGPFSMTPDARDVGREWYKKHFEDKHLDLDPDRFGGYLARKQGMVHKLAMILSASEGSSMVINTIQLATAIQMVTDLEPDMAKVFAKIGQREDAATADRLVSFIRARGKVSYAEAFRFVHAQLPSKRDFEDILEGCFKSGQLAQTPIADSRGIVEMYLTAVYTIGGKPVIPGASNEETLLKNPDQPS